MLGWQCVEKEKKITQILGLGKGWGQVDQVIKFHRVMRAFTSRSWGKERGESQYTRIHMHAHTFMHMDRILGKAPLFHVCAMAFNNRNQWAKLCWVSVTGPGKLH